MTEDVELIRVERLPQLERLLRGIQRWRATNRMKIMYSRVAGPSTGSPNQ